MILIGLWGKGVTILLVYVDVRNPVILVLGFIVCISAAVVFDLGCIHYARAKGWHWWVGLLGVFSLLGLLVLWELETLPFVDDADQAT